MAEVQEKKLITSKDVLYRTGISRDTLINYIKVGIIPRPVIKILKKTGTDTGTRQIAYFPESVVWRIELAESLIREGETVEKIAGQFGGSPSPADSLRFSYNEGQIDLTENFLIDDESVIDPGKPLEPEKQSDIPVDTFVDARVDTRLNTPVDTPADTFMDNPGDIPPDGEPLVSTEKQQTEGNLFSTRKDNFKLTITDMDFPAYLINHNFQVEWVNPKAEELIFHTKISSIDDVESRNIFKLFFSFEFHSNLANWRDIIGLHMPFVQAAHDKKSLSEIYPGMSTAEAMFLENFYKETQPAKGPVSNKAVQLVLKKEDVQYYQVYTIRFREGIFFVYVPADRQSNDILEYLSKRELIINELLKHRMPALVSLCVLVADLQDSVKISAELLPGEYFALINSLWDSLGSCFEKYDGIYGKHAGDGMLYYFIKKPGTDYIMNSINCAIELRTRMKEFSGKWQIKKGFIDDMYLNIGINEGQEFFGTIRSAPTVEFTALGDSINYAGRLSDFARFGEIWTTKTVIGKLDSEKLKDIHFGVNRNVHGRVQFSKNAFSRIIDLIGSEDKNYGKFIDIANLPITQIIDNNPI